MAAKNSLSRAVEPVVGVKWIDRKTFHHPANLQSAEHGRGCIGSDPGSESIVECVELVDVGI